MIVEDIKVCDSAIEQINQIKSQKNSQNKALRILVTGGGCYGLEYKFDFTDVKESDYVIKSQNVVFVCMDKNSYKILKNSEILFEKKIKTGKFKIKNESFTGTCSCGDSFSID